MRYFLALIVALAGCERSAPKPAESPVAAARCVARAVRAEDASALITCMHPTLRAKAQQRIAKGPIPWSRFQAQVEKLERAEAGDFTMKPIPKDAVELGSEVAELRLEDDSLAAVRTRDGYWYVVDTGL